MTKTEIAKVRRQIQAAGYSAKEASTGLRYAKDHDAADAREGLSLAMSRILYSDDDLADGARYGVA